MAKELAVKQEQAVSTEVFNPSDWGVPTQMSQDLLIPKILPMQPSSDLVTDMKAQIGEYRDSISGEKIGSIVEPIEVIPFAVQKFWDISVEGEDGQFQWDHSIPLIEDPVNKDYNDNLLWLDKDSDGKNIKRIRRMNFFVMLPKEIAAGTALPYIFSFKSTSFVEGKKVYSQMYMRNVSQKLPPPAYVFKIGGKKEKNDKGTFIIPTVELGRKSTAAEIAEAFKWYKLVAKGAVKVDDSDLTDGKEVSEMGEAEPSGTGAF